MRIKRAEMQPMVLAEELVDVAELGGEVLVRGLSLGARVTLQAQYRDKDSPAAVNNGHLAPLLALAVLDADDEPLFTAAEWEAFGGKHYATAIHLWDTAYRLSDLGGKEAEKNSLAPTSDLQ